MVEILLALAILSFGVYGAYEQFIQVSTMGRQRLDPVRARYLAQQQLETLRACDFSALKERPAMPAPANHPVSLRYFYHDTITPRPDGALTLTVQVGWNMRAGEPFQPGQSVTVQGVKAP